MSKKPDYTVHAVSLDGEHYKPIGVAWTKKSRTGITYISIQLDFIPPSGNLSIWPTDEKNEKDRSRFDAIAEEMRTTPSFYCEKSREDGRKRCEKQCGYCNETEEK